jgi:hypothetical protein
VKYYFSTLLLARRGIRKLSCSNRLVQIRLKAEGNRQVVDLVDWIRTSVVNRPVRGSIRVGLVDWSGILAAWHASEAGITS